MYVQMVSALRHLKPRRGEQICNVSAPSLFSMSQPVALAFGSMSIDIQTPFACSLEQCTVDEILRRLCIKENVQNSIQLADVNFKMLQKPWGMQVIFTYSVLQAPCVVLSFASVCRAYRAGDGFGFGLLQAFYSVQNVASICFFPTL